jgi:hypothetical protein
MFILGLLIRFGGYTLVGLNKLNRVKTHFTEKKMIAPRINIIIGTSIDILLPKFSSGTLK